MSRNEKLLFIDQAMFNVLSCRGISMLCVRCRKPFRIGQWVITRSRHSRFHNMVRRYHKKCWDGMFA